MFAIALEAFEKHKETEKAFNVMVAEMERRDSVTSSSQSEALASYHTQDSLNVIVPSVVSVSVALVARRLISTPTLRVIITAPLVSAVFYGCFIATASVRQNILVKSVMMEENRLGRKMRKIYSF
jgi:hypothetical protein